MRTDLVRGHYIKLLQYDNAVELLDQSIVSKQNEML